MLFRLTLRSMGPHRGAGRAHFARAALVPLLAAVLLPLASTAHAGPGSGSASIIQPDSAVAGSRHQWTVLYDPSEDFGNPQGGVIEVRIPAGWTPPQRTSSSLPGYVDYTNPTVVSSISISGQSIRMVLGAGPPATKKFLASDLISVLYGVGGPSSLAVTDTVAGIARFTVSSDPQNTGTLDTLAAGSLRVRVLPDTVTAVKIVDGAGIEIGGASRTADQDTMHFFLRGYDRYGNAARFVNGAWRVSGGIGFLTDSTTSSRRLVCTSVGAGKVYADSGAWKDSTLLINVFHGVYAALRATLASTATAGAPFAATAEARDADGNRINDVGMTDALRLLGYADSLGGAPADPLFVNPNATLATGAWSGTLTARRSGIYFIAARDTVTGRESAPRLRLAVSAAVPDHIELRPDTLRLVAGVPDTLTIVARDVFGNRASVAANEELSLWTDRPQGRFEDLSGNGIFSVVIPAGRDSVDFRFRDTQATAAAGRLRAIDANGTAPNVGITEAAVFTSAAPPAGTLTLAALPDTLVANGADSARVVSGVVRDAFGNAAAPGERFTATGAGLGVITDVDSGTPGFQWTVGADSTLSGWVRAGTVAGAAGVNVVSERGSATGAALLVLVAGPPAGGVALAASPDSIAADGLAIRSVTASGLHDAMGNAVVDGEAYTVATTLGSIVSADADAGTPGVQVRASGGAIAFDLSGGNVLGTAVVSAASLRGASSGSVNVRVVPGPVSAESSLVVAASPVPVGAPGSVVTVTLRDRRGHALAGVPSDSIAVSASGVAVVVTPLASGTDAAGAIRFAATATATGTAGVGVVARGVRLAATPSIQFTHGALDTLVVTGPGGPLTAGVAESLRVEARDAFGNAMPDRSDLVHASVLSGGATGLPVSVSLGGGVAVIPFTPTIAAPLLIAVADDSSHATRYGPAGVGAGPAYRIATDPPGADTIPAGGSTVVHARLFDAFGNAAAGDTVLAAVVAGGGNASPARAVTDLSGGADVTLGAGSLPGLVTLRLAAAGSVAPDPVRSDSVSVVVIPASATSVLVATAASVRAGDLLDVAITLRDAFGNVAVGATSTLQLDTSTSLPDSVSWSLGAGAVGTLTDNPADDRASYTFSAADSGTVVLRARFTRAETVRASASGVGPPAQSGDVVVTAAAAARLAVGGGDAQTAVVDHLLAQPLVVIARDAFGNAAPGAVVSFRVRAGGGSLDVVAGAPADSDAVTDAIGAARCDVVRLGLVAGAGNNRIAAALPFPADSAVFTASGLPDTAAAIALAPSSLSLGPGGIATVTASTRDRFGNAVAGAAVTLYLGSAPAGALESLGQTSGTGTTQAGASDAAGQVAVRYHAPTAAPAADLLYARGSSIGPVSIPVSVAPSGVASLAVLPDAFTWTAGTSVRVRVRALDASGNPALGDTATIVMGAAGGAASFAPSFGPLSGGEFVTFASATIAGSLRVTARTATGAAIDSSGVVTVIPAAPAGGIPIAAARDTLTADGRSTTTLLFGPLRDAFGNVAAPGALLTVSADSLVAPDASAAPGLQIATGSDNVARALLVAPATPGTGTIRAASVVGSARDSLAVVYLAPPSLAFAGSLTPSVTAPGQTVQFVIDVRNAAAAGSVTLGTGSLFSFGSGGSAYAVAPAAPVTVPAGATRPITLTAAAVSTSLLPGTYAPSLRLVGTDATGDPLDFYLPLAGAQVHVAGIRVVAVGASPDPAPLGDPALALTFRVDNLAATAASIDAVALTPSTFVVRGVAPSLPAALGPLGSTTVTLTVAVPASGIPDGSDIAADLAVSAAFGGVTVQSVTQSPLSFKVVSGAALAAQSSGTAPGRYLRGRTFAPAARLANSGSAAVTLSPGATRLRLQRGASTLETGLAAATAVPGSGSADLAFDSLAVPAGATLGRYAASLLLSGSESGQAFADTIPLAPDSVDVVEPAILSVAAPLLPDHVSAGQTRPLQLTVANAGDVPFVLDGSTRLALGSPLFMSLVLSSVGSVPARGSLVLTFDAAPLGSPATPPGSAAALLEAHGAEDGRARDEAVDAGSLAVESPARIAFVGGSTAPDTVRAGQTVPLAVTIRNDGGSPFLVDRAATTLRVTDGVESAAASATGTPVPLAPGASMSLSFPSVAFPAALASQAYPVLLTVRGTEWSLAESTTVASPAAELSVVEPVAAIQVRGLPAGAPIQTAAEDGPVRLWDLELMPLIATGGAAASHLRSLAFTVVIDGAPSGNPAAAVDQITLRDDQGTVLAQSAPGAPGKVVLALAAPLALTGPPANLQVEVALHAGSAARSVALRLADPADVDVRDDLTQSSVAVRAAGGLPFEPLTSPAVTLFAKPHGYPNPFRAGREAIRLSYRLAEDAPVHVAIYTLLGDLVREIALAAGAPGGARGLNEVPWDGRNGNGATVRPGVYVARIEGGGVNEAIKVGVLR